MNIIYNILYSNHNTIPMAPKTRGYLKKMHLFQLQKNPQFTISTLFKESKSKVFSKAQYNG